MFIRDSIDLYHKQAVDTGARIVHACGFDSIPSDLSVYALYRRAVAGRSRRIGRHRLRGAQDGRWTLRRHRRVDDGRRARHVRRCGSSRRLLEDPYTLTPDRGAEPELGPQPDLPWRRGRQIAPELDGIWTAGFMMAAHQHPNCQAQQRITGLGIRQTVPVLRVSEPRIFGRGAGRVGDGDRRKCRGHRTGQPLLRQAAGEPRRTRRPEAGHRPERTRPRERALHRRDIHHHHDRAPAT